ncbi:translocation/assembly module TamB domain-containing protein [Rhodohalobacter mucosus]|uniref:Autotransporter translocation and assembly factor TamB n=1 Tax=Rhodohalobacter mucosus TaxID=2079485 RepID=A0A316TSC5_9BACT|nr:hypothetical protein [Rhodohalobacter mucosus]PWN06229.1 hypothetical protein DDZ15_10390 [Rhodohalobacter mucosus]
MIYRWLYKLWRYFWITVAVVLLTAFCILTATVLILQLPQTREFMKDEVVDRFNEQYEGTLEIENVSGFLPLKAEVTNGRIFAPSDTLNPVLSFGRAEATFDWWELIQQNITISSFELYEPSIVLNRTDGVFNFGQAVREKEEFRSKNLLETGEPVLVGELNIFAPNLNIINGTVQVEESINIPEGLEIRTPFSFREVNASLFIEITDSQIFADILNINATIPDSDYEYITTSGQVYSDDRFFELNSFRIRTGLGQLQFGLEATPVNLFGNSPAEQFRNADITAEFRNSTLSTPFIRRYFPDYPDFEQELSFELIAEGNRDEFFIDRFQASVDESFLTFSGVGRDLLTDDLSYDIQLENLVLHPDNLTFALLPYLPETDLSRYDITTFRGDLNGSKTELRSELSMETGLGGLNLNASVQLPAGQKTAYEFSIEADSLTLSPFLRDTVQTTMLTGLISGSGMGITDSPEYSLTVNLDESVLAGHTLRQLEGSVDYSQNRYDYTLSARDIFSSVRSSGFYSNNDSRHHLFAETIFDNLNLLPYTEFFDGQETDLNGSFTANIMGSSFEDIWGRINLEMNPSAIGPNRLRAHQLYADINQPDPRDKTLRFTSSFFDGEISGTLSPSLLIEAMHYWGRYLEQRINEEILLSDNFSFNLARAAGSPQSEEIADVDLDLMITLKDINLLRNYLPALPETQSSSRLSASLTANTNRLQLSGNLFDESLTVENARFENLNSSLTLNLRHDRPLRAFSLIDFQVNASSASVSDMNFTESFLNLTTRNDFIELEQQLVRSDSISVRSSITGVLSENLIELQIDRFDFGSEEYSWATQGSPLLQFRDNNTLTVTDMILTSDEDLIEISGTLSPDPEDAVQYRVSNLDLSRISNLIGARVSFSGFMNGEFTTRSLTQIPSVQGNIQVEETRLNGRLVGDLSLNSVLNSEEQRFDTDIRIFTDPDKYSGYIRSNDGIGQDIRLNGYFRLPDDANSEEDLYYFDADLREIDMWIVPVITPNIITDMEGNANGSGFIRGNRDDFDFEATFTVADVYGVPAFTNVEYMVDGLIEFNKTEGLLFRSLELTDNFGGTGELTGQVDLDNFSPTTYIDLNLELNNLQFMNNPYDPDIPFYGELYGTGEAQITGTNFSPYIRTLSAVTLSQNSRISIPLEEQTEFEQDRRFIQFVDSFDEALQRRASGSGGTGNGDGEEIPDDLTFAERFTMDLQFTAPNPLNVDLIFDRVTNEVLSANGTGQISLRLEDQDVSMFGRFNIEGGDYQFVSGDIFTRRFTLQEGGAISWQGDLIDASLNVTAVYRARPSISSLLGSTGTQQVGQRIPVELVLQIGGTISAVENNFFFRVPTGIEGTLDPALATQINSLNQNEEEKLIQATSILLSGNFLPSSQAQGLGLEGISGTAAVVNPLLTSQVINPLLSNQINSLLRSDITFDIDLNLTAFDEVDLGVALRLFDDRVILRREGQITGEQGDIGDLGATYRINRTFSITAFHRQDPTLIAREGNAASGNTQTQEMNGVGLEARFQFNTWKDFGRNISESIRKFFGIQRKEETEDETGDSTGNSAAIN